MKISEDVLIALSESTVEGNVLRLAGQLDRKVYLATDKVLKRLGGKWNRKVGGHVFDVSDVAERIEGVVAAGVFADLKNEFNLFETPPELARALCARAGIGGRGAGEFILEPSAGRGALIQAIMACDPTAEVGYFEIQPDLADALQVAFPHRLVRLGLDFMEAGVVFDMALRGVDAVVMNPPFSGKREVDHVHRALDILEMARAPKGLSAVMSTGVTFRTDTKTKMFRDRLKDLRAEVTDNPPGSFWASGTNVNTVTVSVRF